MSTYEPGKRHWLKVKKDYLNEGAMADTADLVVLGGWYGTGNKVSELLDNDERAVTWQHSGGAGVRLADGLSRQDEEQVVHSHQVWQRLR